MEGSIRNAPRVAASVMTVAPFPTRGDAFLPLRCANGGEADGEADSEADGETANSVENDEDDSPDADAERGLMVGSSLGARNFACGGLIAPRPWVAPDAVAPSPCARVAPVDRRAHCVFALLP